MATKKYQVFVSSTFRDLVEERQDTIRNILDLNHIPAGMELFPAADVEQLSYIKKVIDECDYYLLIVGGRYGSLDAEGVSFTEREYDYAVETGKFVIAFVHGDPDGISVKNSDVKPEIVEALNEFRDKVKTGRLVREWTDRQNLENAVIKSLSFAFSNFPQVGWIRGDSAANDQVLESANRALQDNAKLHAELAGLKSQTPTIFEDLADLDDSYIVRYRTQHKAQYGRSFDYSNRTTALTWRQIFVALAAELTTSKTDAWIPASLKNAIKEAGVGYNAYDFNDTDLARIKAQLIALGLIKATVDTTLKGTYQEFLSLTDMGRKIYFDTMVVRKPPVSESR